jgi:hypothetical protein
VPEQFVAQFASSGAGASALDITGTGDLGSRILASLPDAIRPSVEPLIPAIVHGIHEAFSIALSTTFWIGIGGALLAALLVLLLHEVPMRTTFDFAAAPVPEGEESAA